MSESVTPPRDPLASLPRHGALNIAATLAPGIYSALLVAFFLHALGPAGYAPWAAAMALVGWMTLLDAGLANTTTREAARALAGSAEAVARVQATNALYAALAVGAAIIGTIGSLAVPWLLRLDGGSAFSAWLVGVTLSIDLAIVLGTSAWMGVLRGARRFEYVLITNLTQVSVSLATTFVLFPSLGLVGAGCGQIVGRVASRVVAAWLVRRTVTWFGLLPRRHPRAALLAVGGFSLPILAMQVATQLGVGTDIVVVSSIAGSTTVGLYAAGSQLARFASQFLFSTFGVLLPTFSSVQTREPGMVRSVLLRGLLLCSIFGAAVFGSLALESGTIMSLWAGQADPLSVAVLRIYAVAFIVVTPANVLILMLIAHGRHGIVGALVLIEASINVVLSVILSRIVGPIGVAISSLTMMAIDDLVVIPFVTSKRLGIPLRQLAMWVASGIAVGLAIAGAIQVLPVHGLAGFLIRLLLGAILLAAVVLVAWRATGGLATAESVESAAAGAPD